MPITPITTLDLSASSADGPIARAFRIWAHTKSVGNSLSWLAPITTIIGGIFTQNWILFIIVGVVVYIISVIVRSVANSILNAAIGDTAGKIGDEYGVDLRSTPQQQSFVKFVFAGVLEEAHGGRRHVSFLDPAFREAVREALRIIAEERR